MARLYQGVTGPGSSAVLPDDGPVKGATGAAIPRHHSFPLVGDPDGDRVSPGLFDPTGHLGQGGSHRRPDLPGIVLHPSRTRKVLGELAMGTVDHNTPGIEHLGPDPGGTCVDGDGD